MPIKWKTKILLAKIEASYGVDSGPTGAANAVLATQVTLSPMEGQDVSRDLDLPYLAAQATIPAGLFQRLTFRVELAPSGALGVAPAWGPLLRACGVAQTINVGASVVYNPVTEAHESLTFHLWIGTTRYVLLGSRGTAVLRYNAQGIPYLEFSFTGLFNAPSDQSRPTASLTGFKAPQIVTNVLTPTFTLDGAARVMRNTSLNLGNDVQTRFLVGSESVLIVDRADLLETQIEAVDLAVWDPFAKAQAGTSMALSLVHGVGAGKISTLAVPALQLQRPASLANQQNIVEWPLRGTPLPTAGNDQWTLTLT
jgi:hypothetical protein